MNLFSYEFSSRPVQEPGTTIIYDVPGRQCYKKLWPNGDIDFYPDPLQANSPDNPFTRLKANGNLEVWSGSRRLNMSSIGYGALDRVINARLEQLNLMVVPKKTKRKWGFKSWH